LLSLGGKLTSARQDAATLVDRVCRKLGQRRSCATLGRPLPWAPAGDFAAFSEAALTQGRDLGLADEDVHWLIFRHGRRIEEIFAGLASHPELGQRLFPDAPFLRADLLHCAQWEMVVHLEDLLRRRLCLLLLRPARRPELEALAAEVAPILGWDGARRRLEVECCLGMEGPRSNPLPASLAAPAFENGEPDPPLARHS
jgi:glycerol-3-phosphate dehydrogenase